VKAGATELVLLDQCDRQAQLGTAQGSGIAATSSAEDDDIEFSPGHGRSLWVRIVNTASAFMRDSLSLSANTM
jgi:hypothetical protein